MVNQTVSVEAAKALIAAAQNSLGRLLNRSQATDLLLDSMAGLQDSKEAGLLAEIARELLRLASKGVVPAAIRVYPRRYEAEPACCDIDVMIDDATFANGPLIAQAGCVPYPEAVVKAVEWLRDIATVRCPEIEPAVSVESTQPTPYQQAVANEKQNAPFWKDLDHLLDLIGCSDTLREDCDDDETVQEIRGLAEKLAPQVEGVSRG